MQKAEIMENLKDYIANQVLDGQDVGLESTTPLLEWGVINSMEIVRLVTYVQTRFGVGIPDDKIVADYFKDLSSLTNLVLELMERNPSE